MMPELIDLGTAWVIASIPVTAYLFSTCFSSGISAYFRIHPAICNASRSMLVYQMMIGAVLLAAVLGVSRLVGSFAFCLRLLLPLLLVVVVLILYRLRREASTADMALFVLGLLLLAAFSVVCWCSDRLGLVFDWFYDWRGLVFSLDEALILLFVLCGLSFCGGVIDAETRKFRQFNVNKGELLLAVFSDGAGVFGKIARVEIKEGRKFFYFAEPLRYGSVLSESDRYMWVRCHRCIPARKGKGEHA